MYNTGITLDIVELYEDDQFNNLLNMIAEKNSIRDFDDYRQDVFEDIIQRGCKNMTDYRRAARKIGMQYYRANKDIDIESLAYENENGEIESADETMSRLVYHGKGRYV